MKAFKVEDTSAYKKGWTARSLKKPLRDNPFSGHEAVFWRVGWEDADKNPVLKSEEMMK